MNLFSAKNKEPKDKFYFSLRRLTVHTILLSIVSFAVLLTVLVSINMTKIINNALHILNGIEAAVVETEKNSGDAENTSVEKYINALAFARYSQALTGVTPQGLVEFVQKYYPENTTFVCTRDGTMLASSAKKIEVGDFTLDELMTMIQISGRRFIYVDDYRVFFLRLFDRETYLVSFVKEDNTEGAVYEVRTPAEAIASVMRRNGYSDTDENYAFLYIREDQSYFTEEGRIDAERAKEFVHSGEGMIFTNQGGERFQSGLLFRDQKYYLYFSKYNKELNADITFYTYPSGEIQSAVSIAFMVQLTFLIVLFLFSIFVYHLRQYHWIHPENKDYSEKENSKKELILALIALILVSSSAYFSQTLFSLSVHVLDDNEELEVVKQETAEYKKQNEKTKQIYTTDMITTAKIIAEFFSKNPDLMNSEYLNLAVSTFGLQYATLFDLDGNEMVSSEQIFNYSFPQNQEDPASIYNQLKRGVPSVYIEPGYNPLLQMDGARAAVSIYRKDDNGLIGFLEIGREPGEIMNYASEPALNQVLKNLMITETYCAVDPETRTISYAREEGLIGSDASELGFTEESLQPEFFGLISYGGMPSYASSRKIDNKLVYIIHLGENVYYTRAPYTIAAMVMFFLSELYMFILLRTRRKGYKEVIYATERQCELIQDVKMKEAVGKGFTAEEEDNEAQRPGLRKRIGEFSLSWLFQTPERKLFSAFTLLAEIAAILLLAVFATYKFSAEEHSLLVRIMSGKWARGLNVFSLTANLILIMTAIVGAALIRWMLRMIGEISDARGETVTRLLRSAVSYSAFLITAYFVLLNIGVNPTALATSAGLTGIAIGIGARDLITDITAGLFIIFEGSFQVGDFIDVAGYQGQIKEIGVRTTTVTGFDMDEKIINNRNMSNVINMSAKSCYTVLSFAVPYTASLDELTEILKKALIDFKGLHPQLASVPYFKFGSTQLAGKTHCHIIAEIPELSRALIASSLESYIRGVLEEKHFEVLWLKQNRHRGNIM